MIMNNENDATSGTWQKERTLFQNGSLQSVARNEVPHTDRVMSGRTSVIRNNDADGDLLATHCPVTKSNPS